MQPSGNTRSSLTRSWKILVIAAILLVFLAVLGVKLHRSQSADAGLAGSVSAQRVDAVTAFERARASGRPVYLLFHSLTCQPCVEISANVDQVVPGYAGKVTFVNAITDDPTAQQLAARFNFQYIPTSFFIGRDGAVLDSFTGVLSPAELKTRLDQLADS